MRKARRSAGSSRRSTRPSFSSWSTIAGDVAAGHHQQARQLVHLQPVGMALELRHQVEARQRGAEAARAGRERTARSISWVQVSRRSQMRSARWSSARAMVSRSVASEILSSLKQIRLSRPVNRYGARSSRRRTMPLVELAGCDEGTELLRSRVQRHGAVARRRSFISLGCHDRAAPRRYSFSHHVPDPARQIAGRARYVHRRGGQAAGRHRARGYNTGALHRPASPCVISAERDRERPDGRMVASAARLAQRHCSMIDRAQSFAAHMQDGRAAAGHPRKRAAICRRSVSRSREGRVDAQELGDSGRSAP